MVNIRLLGFLLQSCASSSEIIVIATYAYNGIGQRIKKVVGATTRIFHYDQMGHLIAETDQSGQMISEYVYLGDQLLAMIKPGGAVYYYHNDHLGTPRVLTDATGSIAWKATYNPFGEATISSRPLRIPSDFRANTTTQKRASTTITSGITIPRREDM